MYIKKLTSWLFMLLAMALAACSDVTEVGGGDTPDVSLDGSDIPCHRSLLLFPYS